MTFTIFVTSKCNLKCKYCYEGYEKSNKDMNKETADEVLKFILRHVKSSKEDDKVNINFHGGTPLLNFDLIKYFVEYLIKNIQSHKLIFNMTTNGILLNDEVIEYIEKYITNISISIDGTMKAHDLNRYFTTGIGTYKQVVQNSNRIICKNKNVRARMTFNSETVNELYEGIKILAEMGFKYIVSIPDYYDSKWSKEDIEKLNEQMAKMLY